MDLQMTSDFRQYLPDLTLPRFTAMKHHDAQTYAAEFKADGYPPWLHALYQHWLRLLEEPYKGVTSNGTVQPDLFILQDEGTPIDDIVVVAREIVNALDETQRDRTLHHIDSPQWRTWSNPEHLLSDKGIRLDEIHHRLRERVMNLLRISLSPEGFKKAVSAMRLNGFLGDLVDAKSICNKYSYNFVLFGRPSNVRPWGYSFYGHHLCLNFFFIKSQIIISPWFTGAEPNMIDTGPYAGTRILHREDHLGLQLMQSLSPSQQRLAQIYEKLRDTKMHPGRWNRDDQRHLCGAYQDNRVVPYEGVTVSSMDSDQVNLVTEILKEYLCYLPSKARQLRMSRICQYYDETYFCWIGGFSDVDAFYYRIQSPVVIVEFDHHSGVFLNNEQPARFHIHTLLRTPNGGDYGKALLPLIPGEEQAFVWHADEVAELQARDHGHQSR